MSSQFSRTLPNGMTSTVSLGSITSRRSGNEPALPRRHGEGRPGTRERRKPSLPYREIANVTIFSVLLSSYAIISFDSIPLQSGHDQIKLFLSFILFFSIYHLSSLPTQLAQERKPGKTGHLRPCS